MQIRLNSTPNSSYFMYGKLNVGNNAKKAEETKTDANGTTVQKQPNTIQNKKHGKLIESLMQQKQNMLDLKNKVISKAIEKGIDVSDLKEQIKSYDDAIQDIDDQISQAMLKEQEKQLEKAKEKGEKEEKPDAIEENLANKGFQTVDKELTTGVAAASANLEVSAAAKQVYTQAKGELRVAESYDGVKGADYYKSVSKSASRKMDVAMGYVAKSNKSAMDSMENAKETTMAKEDYKEKHNIGDENAPKAIETGALDNEKATTNGDVEQKENKAE